MNKVVKSVSLVMLLLFFRVSFTFSAEKVYFYYSDPAGTPLAISDATGTVVWRADYLPFGEETIDLSTVQNNKLFVGKEKDAESGLLNFGARLNDPTTGRFISPDSVGPVDPQTGKINQKMLHNPQMLSRYTYALNNPYRFIDPDGLSPADRVAWAMSQLNNKDAWKGSWRTPYNCNVFVASAHELGDPDLAHFPSVLRAQTNLDKALGTFSSIPTVQDLADPTFASSELSYLPASAAQPGDIVVWYGGGVHHTALYTGDGNVIYQSKSEGVKEMTVKEVTDSFRRSSGFKGNPIVRRYVYPSE